MSDENAMLEKLQQTYRHSGLEIRFYRSCLTNWRWQCGWNGGDQFELLAWASTAEGLTEAIRAKAQAALRGEAALSLSASSENAVSPRYIAR
jgi:hypothetical protein